MEKFFQAEKTENDIRISGEPSAAYGWRPTESFVEWNWDGNCLTVVNDRYGIYPCFYYESPGRIAVSTSISALLDLTGDTEFDTDALALFLRLGWIVGEDTLFKRIKALPPGCKLTWQDGKIDIETNGIIVPKKQDMSREDAIRRYAELFGEAIRKTAPAGGRTVVPLSGGRDSRHILFELHRQGRIPDACVTMLHPPPRADEDARIAAKVCEELDIPHHLIGQPRSRFATECNKNHFTGYSAYEHGWFFGLSPFISGKWDNIYDGLAGDVLSAGLFLDEERLRLFREGGLKELAEKIMEPEGYINELLIKTLGKQLSRERASARLQKELSRHIETPNPVGSFYFWNRTRRCVALSPFRLIRETEHVITPYIEPGLFDLLASLPAEMFLDHEFHTETISKSYPEFAHIPYEKKRVGPVHDIANYRSFMRSMLKYAFSPRKRKLVNRSFFVKRALASQILSSVNHSVAYYGEQATHLLQLERL